MRASVLLAPGVIEMQDRDVPTVGPGDVLVKVEAIGVCGSDTHFYQNGRIGDLVVEGPVVLGHETAGTIVQVGELVDPSRVGERVSIEPQRPCRRCVHCRMGTYNQCETIEFFGAYPTDGSFSDFVAVPADFAYELPSNLSMAEGALIEPLAVAVYAGRTARLEAGDTVLIAGAGPIGLLIAQVAWAAGATTVTISDPSAERRDIASRLTKAEVVAPEQVAQLSSKSLFFDASGAPSAIRAGIAALAVRGRAVLVGMGMDEVSIPLSVVQHRELSLTGVFRYSNAWPLALEMARSEQINLRSLITHEFDLEHVEDALLAASRSASAVKSVVLLP